MRFTRTGLHQGGKQLLFFDTSGEVAKHSIRVPVASLAQEDLLTIQTDLVDQHCYVFDRRAVFKALDAKPTIAAIKEACPWPTKARPLRCCSSAYSR